MSLNPNTLPIAILDSGLGGLQVLKTCKAMLPNENFIYLGDTARLPYGTKSPQVIQGFLRQNIMFLKLKVVKAIVVSCHSASSVLKVHEFDQFTFYKVTDPTTDLACRISTGGRIGVIATRTTVNSQIYPKRLQQQNPNLKIFQQSASLLPALVEEAWTDDPLTNLVVYRYLSPLLSQGIDTLILGCTHFPQLISSFKKVVGNSIQIVDPSKAIGQKLCEDIQSNILPKNPNTQAGKIDYFVTDSNPWVLSQAQRMMSPIQVAKLEIAN